MLTTRLVSSMEKCFPDSNIERFPLYNGCSALRGMQTSFQLLYRESDTRGERPHNTILDLTYAGDLVPYMRVRAVEYIPSLMPVYPGKEDDNYLRTAPGLYPDLLREMHYHGRTPKVPGQSRALWFDITVPADAPLTAGKHTLEIEVSMKRPATETVEVLANQTFTLDLIDAVLPEQDFPVTQWFHCDCLADYYHVPVFSEEHWRIIESFVRTSVQNGNNMLLTPLFTPPLDTAVGGERATVQLVDVTVTRGKYSFGYQRLDRWLAMCRRCGVKWYEIAHLFTQWGALYAPKVMATVDGEERRIFGWDTPGTGAEYMAFMDAFLPDFIAHMKALGEDRKCVFHISDEPGLKHLEGYKKARDVVKKHLDGYTTMDALSNYEFYEQGLVETPIPASNHIAPFLEHKAKNLWVYYCCSQVIGTSNRMFAMPGWRTRYMGVQMYYHDIKGFLHWGYNYYYSFHSTDLINPFVETTGDGFFPSGDGFSVYPAPDGSALESTRLLHFREGLDDMRLCRLCESLCGREAVTDMLRSLFGEVDFAVCATAAAPLLKMREGLLSMIREQI